MQIFITKSQQENNVIITIENRIKYLTSFMGGAIMVVHKNKELTRAAKNLASDKTSKKTKQEASKVLNTHKKKKH